MIAIAVLVLSAVLIAAGVIAGEPDTVFNKALFLEKKIK